MLSEPKSLGHNVGVDLCLCPVAVLEDVVLPVQAGESFGQGQFAMHRDRRHDHTHPIDRWAGSACPRSVFSSYPVP
ncbi:hypothetical protein [Streptomyces sp. NPDC048419]|uniref:hypothetical protein n=1 Tax=Streptomyces sp. NPDC048419 TaxID=3365547 RepID=UPI0037208B6A